ncbi:leucine-rich repeat protein [Lacinutrix sp. WUR7]|uniref:leucine-rich repeat domain-containing protein n=1 Tax=Lacinutrix sp. WUR7 TaxID=2653681 RepID=UPI00193DC77C|nr:leucine-rich repeat domain-containing protein [Lacinutrix sp. WUR7]QRM90329.1 leucine-rich repeat protein [Lacinutrix sp. WUR7]
MKNSLLILMALFMSIIGYSQSFTDGFIAYTVTSTTNNTVKTIAYSAAGGVNLTIPATATDTSVNPPITYAVTRIGIGSFNQVNNLETVSIPTSVTVIEAATFSGNTNLISAPLHNGITSIGANAFFNCGLTSVNIPTGMTIIEGGSFSNNNINTLTIPSTITSIEDTAFQNNQLTSVAIPDSVTSIGSEAFRNNQLTSAIIPNSVISIGFAAFFSNPLTCVVSEATTPPTIITNTSLTAGILDTFAANRSNIHLSIPSGTASAYATAQWTGFNSVSEGLAGTFVVDNITYQINASPNNEVTVTDYNTAGGTVVNIPATVSSGCTDFSVTDIGLSAFVANQLTSVTIPSSVINIGTAAFAQNQLVTVVIPDSVLTIGWNAFTQNYALTNLDLGNGVETIGVNAFSDNFIVSITIPDSVLTIAENAFGNSFALSNLVIGNSVVSIGDNAFTSNSSTFTSVTIPSSVTTIGEYAFAIAALTDVFSESTTPPTITTGGNDTFGAASYRANIHLHIPAGTMGAYVTDAGALWTGFMSVTEDALSISDFELANEVKVVNTLNALKIISTGVARLENYTIYSITGAKVKKGTNNTIAIDALSSGIYILELNFDTGKLTKKFAK